ncbi:PREDICTED: uncharacterized protein LOC106811506 [Priapulus caudatus]|uniref:Uncharacterized protein LOC106811506 n=1 Tax=Priapulus caudatus TaxID=37621 RepID=A0ABM1EEL5_PRICU|nr:PREDICTED: uncharacterized protein LOC106811506 [Priapulus caudatus]
MDSEELDRLAREELVNEAKRGAERYDTLGPIGWQKPRSTNKVFFSRTLMQALQSPAGYRTKRTPADRTEDNTDVDGNQSDHGSSNNITSGTTTSHHHRTEAKNTKRQKTH